MLLRVRVRVLLSAPSSSSLVSLFVLVLPGLPQLRFGLLCMLSVYSEVKRRGENRFVKRVLESVRPLLCLPLDVGKETVIC